MISYIDRLNKKSLLWELSRIELFFFFSSTTSQCWLFEQGHPSLSKTMITFSSKYNDCLLAPFITNREIELYKPNPTDDEDLLKKLT